MADPNPVTPDEIEAIIPSPTSSICDRLTRVLLRFPNLIFEFWEWAFDSSGNITKDFRNQLFRPGDYIFSANSAPPTGALFCDGSNVSRTTYAALFAVIGTSFGVGDGSTTFGLPNWTDRVPRGHGATAPNAAGGSDTDTINQTAAQMPSHQHYIGVEGSGLTHAVSDGFLRADSGADINFVQSPSTKAAITEETGDGDDMVIDVVQKHYGVYVYIQT